MPIPERTARRRPRQLRWWIAGALVVLVTPPLAAYLWLFELDAIGPVVHRERAGTYTITVRARRTSAWLPWLATHELVVTDPAGARWHARVRAQSGGTPRLIASGGELLVERSGGWHGHDLATGVRRWSSADVEVVHARECGDVTIAVDDDWVAHAMDHTSGRARWSRRIEPPFGMELDDVIVPFGAHEVVLGAELVDLRTGLGDPAVRWPFVIAGEEIVWDEGAAVMRRPPGAPARAALEVPSMLSLDAFSAAEALVVVASRATAWAPEVARRDVPERVSLDQLTPRDSTVIVALGSHDEVRWVVATHGALRGGCDLPALGMVGVELSRVAGDRFERSAFAIHRATGAVLSVDGPHVCSAEMPPSPSR